MFLIKTLSLKATKIFLFCVLFYFLSRIFFYNKGIDFNGFGFWQIANLDLLKSDFINTIYYFHYQPPLWNMLIGFIVKITGHNQNLAEDVLLLIHWFFSIGILFIIYKLKLNLNFSNKILITGLFTVILNPSLIFFENFALYNHFSNFIFFIIFYNFYLLAKNKHRKHENYILFLSLLLTATWPMFHPIFIIIVFFLITYVKKNFELKTLIISIFFL